MASQDGHDTFVYVGTYTATKRDVPHREHGIYVYRMDPASGALTLAHRVGGLLNPSFLALGPRHRYLYTVNEVGEVAGGPSGAVSAFAVDPTTGALEYLNQQPSLGTSPCHLSVDATGRFVLVANYSSGSVAIRALATPTVATRSATSAGA
jgi:6-phosphogluconolactonase